VILASASDTRRLVLSEAMEEKYTILRNGKVLFKNLTQEEYFDIMEDLSIEYYQKGSPNPSTLETKIIRIG